MNHEINVILESEHPNIARVIQVQETEINIYCVMELLPQGSLANLLKIQISLSEDEVKNIARQICLACSFMHEKGIIHRDLNPSNILISELDPKSME